jgi:hypothetical protein
MSTPPRIETIIEHRRPWRRVSRRVLTRAAWLTADLGAIAACVVLVLHG